MKKAAALPCCLPLVGSGQARPPGLRCQLLVKNSAQTQLLHQIQLLQAQRSYQIFSGN